MTQIAEISFMNQSCSTACIISKYCSDRREFPMWMILQQIFHQCILMSADWRIFHRLSSVSSHVSKSFLLHCWYTVMLSAIGRSVIMITLNDPKKKKLKYNWLQCFRKSKEFS